VAPDSLSRRLQSVTTRPIYTPILNARIKYRKFATKPLIGRAGETDALVGPMIADASE